MGAGGHLPPCHLPPSRPSKIFPSGPAAFTAIDFKVIPESFFIWICLAFLSHTHIYAHIPFNNQRPSTANTNVQAHAVLPHCQTVLFRVLSGFFAHAACPFSPALRRLLPTDCPQFTSVASEIVSRFLMDHLHRVFRASDRLDCTHKLPPPSHSSVILVQFLPVSDIILISANQVRPDFKGANLMPSFLFAKCISPAPDPGFRDQGLRCTFTKCVRPPSPPALPRPTAVHRPPLRHYQTAKKNCILHRKFGREIQGMFC